MKVFFGPVKAWIHFPKAVKEQFIDRASFNLSPDAFDFLILSLPAKSTKYKVPPLVLLF